MDDGKKSALEFFQQAYQLQMNGQLEEAVEFYRKSIEIYPTGEAHTFLGWTYSFMRRYDDAIEECHKAIAVDPDFGNPYNDIGAYLIEQGRFDEAIPWLEEALRARRYESYFFPHLNLGRIWEQKHDYRKARQSYRQALKPEPTIHDRQGRPPKAYRHV